MGAGYKTPSLSTFGQIRGAIVDAQGNVTPQFQRYLTTIEAKTNQTLSLAGNTTLNNIVSATPSAFSPTVNVTGAIDMPEMAVSITVKGNPVLIIFSATVQNDTAGRFTLCQLLIDGVVQPQTVSTFTSALANSWGACIINYLDSPLPGAHQYKIQWASSLGGAVSTNEGTQRNFQVVELG